uniref:Uncharacterized protein n=1 Tax=Nymphaea colorata TaxID=210225 RepID=A0A5K1G871_9MAGN
MGTLVKWEPYRAYICKLSSLENTRKVGNPEIFKYQFIFLIHLPSIPTQPLCLSPSPSVQSQKYKSGDLPIMGNIMEACIQRKEEAKAEAAGKPEKAEPKQGLDFVGGCEEADEGDVGGGSCSDKKEGRVRVKVVLRKQELEWLLMHCREDGGKALEELLMGIHNSRKGHDQYQNHHDRGWKPALASIMEIPELQTVES